jgi:hypothetical protein
LPLPKLHQVVCARAKQPPIQAQHQRKFTSEGNLVVSSRETRRIGRKGACGKQLHLVRGEVLACTLHADAPGGSAIGFSASRNAGCVPSPSWPLEPLPSAYTLPEAVTAAKFVLFAEISTACPAVAARYNASAPFLTQRELRALTPWKEVAKCSTRNRNLAKVAVNQ